MTLIETIKYKDIIQSIFTYRALVIFLFFVIVIVVGHYFVRLILYILKKTSNNVVKDDKSLKGAGAIIGVFERFLILICILREYTIIGLVLTAKTIIRFGEFKERKFAEYYLIGTLSSIFFTIIGGLISHWLLEFFKPI